MGWTTSECEYDGNWHATSREREAGDGVGAGWYGWSGWSESPTRDDKLATALEDLKAIRTSQSAMKKRLTLAEDNVDDLYYTYQGMLGEAEEERKHREQRVARFKQWLKNLAIAMFAGGFIAVYCLYWTWAADIFKGANFTVSQSPDGAVMWTDEWLLNIVPQLVLIPVFFLTGFAIAFMPKVAKGSLGNFGLTMLAIGCCFQLLGQVVSMNRFVLNGNCSLNGQMGELAAMAGAMNVANCVLAFYNIEKNAGQVAMKDEVAEKDAELNGFGPWKNKKEVYGGWY